MSEPFTGYGPMAAALPNEVTKVPEQATQPSGGGTAEAPSTTLPLDPGNGGRSISDSALQTGDIIVSTTNEFVSKAIRRVTGQPISHSIIYIGDGQIVEAVSDGVILRSIGEALADAIVAVAFRKPSITPTQAMEVRDYAGQQLNKVYDRLGIFRQVLFQLARLAFCSGKTGNEYSQCVNWVGRVNLGSESNDQFFCSELVIAAFEQAGVSLVATQPHWNTPGDIASLHLSEKLAYVGHLKIELSQ